MENKNILENENNLVEVGTADLEDIAGGTRDGTIGIGIVNAKVTSVISAAMSSVKIAAMASVTKDETADIIDAVFKNAEERILNKVEKGKGMNASTIIKIVADTICECMNVIPGIPSNVKRALSTTSIRSVIGPIIRQMGL